MRIIQPGAGALYLLQDISGFGGPDERPGVCVVMVDVVKDSEDQILDTMKHSATQAVFGQIAEKAFHHV